MLRGARRGRGLRAGHVLTEVDPRVPSGTVETVLVKLRPLVVREAVGDRSARAHDAIDASGGDAATVADARAYPESA